MSPINNTYSLTLTNYFTEKVRHIATISLFRKCIYVFIILNTIILIPIADILWSPEAYIAHHYATENSLVSILTILSHPLVNPYYWIFIIGQLLFCTIGLIGLIPRISSVLVFFFYVNLYHNAIAIQHGGNDLLKLFLFYLIFINDKPYNNHKLNSLNITITNFAFLACQIQVCMLYFISALYKLTGTYWLDGSAIYYVLNINEFTTPFFREYIAPYDWLTVPFTYLTLVFQLCFPVFVWIKQLKPLTLSIGIVLHVCIALMMGLLDFSIIMMIAYILFLNESTSRKISTSPLAPLLKERGIYLIKKGK